jgi:hypothetical protein
MSTLYIPDPSLTHKFVILVQVNGDTTNASVTVRLPTDTLPPAAFDPTDFSGPEQTANQAVIGALITKAKTRWEAMAAAHTDGNGNPDPNTINWVAP